MNRLQDESCVSKPAHAARARIGPHSANHDTLTAKPSSHHVHVTLWVTPPTSPCPTLSANAEPARVVRRDYLFCAVRSMMQPKGNLGFKGLTRYLMAYNLVSRIFRIDSTNISGGVWLGYIPENLSDQSFYHNLYLSLQASMKTLQLSNVTV